MLRRAIAFAVVCSIALVTPARADRIVAIAPLTTVGEEDTSVSTKKILAQLEAAAATLPGTKVVTAVQVADAIKRSKKPQLKTCETDTVCLSELGRLVSANYVIAGEVVGLGEAKVIYLGATDVGAARELRSTTLTLGNQADSGGPAGAIVRLLEPEKYRGNLHFAIDVKGATVYVNGSRTALSPQGDVSLPVGQQAVRVTHSEYRDFVKFIDVQYGKTVDVAVGMTQYPIIQRDLQGKPINRDQISYVDPPLHKRWYVVGGAALGLAILTGIIVGYAVHDFPDGVCRKVGGEPC